MTFYIFHRHSLPSRSCGFNLQLVQLVGRFWVFFLSHPAPGFSCGFISTYAYGSSTGVCSWGCPGGLGLPLWGLGMVVQLLGSQGFWQHQVLRGVGGLGSREYSVLEGDGNQDWPVRSSMLAWRNPSLTEKPGGPVYRVAKSQTWLKQPCGHRCKILFCLWQLCPSQS